MYSNKGLSFLFIIFFKRLVIFAISLYLPFLVLFTVLAIKDSDLGIVNVGLFFLCAFAFSKVWWVFDIPADVDIAAVSVFPLQKLFMQYGPWMNNDMYVLHGIAVIVLTAIIWAFFIRSKETGKA